MSAEVLRFQKQLERAEAHADKTMAEAIAAIQRHATAAAQIALLAAKLDEAKDRAKP